mmetsp:Transcript_12614/g.20791  ORF Transcript_12614/g.20791 Transcript_12614/m.20791 type:complete len:667 (-) Transcript_12614:17-2017(-)
MDGLRNLSAIAADMPRLDCSSNATSHTHGLRYKAEPLETDTHEGSQALLRLSSQSRSSVTESEGDLSSIHPSQPASVNMSAQKESSMSLVAQLPFSTSVATAAIGGSYPHGLDPFSSSTLDEYYKSQAKIHQVYVNNAVAAAAATSSMPTTPFPGGLGVSSVPATLAIIRGSPFDQYHPNTAEELSILQHYYGQQQPVNDHYLPYYCPATTSILMDQIEAKMAANYTAMLGQRQQQEQQQQKQQINVEKKIQSISLDETNRLIRVNSAPVKEFSSSPDIKSRSSKQQPQHILPPRLQNKATQHPTTLPPSILSTQQSLDRHYPPLEIRVVNQVEFHGLNTCEFFQVFFSDDAPYSMKDFQQKRGDVDVVYGLWKDVVDIQNLSSFQPGLLPLPPDSTRERTLTFNTLTKSYFGPAYAKATKIQRATQLSKHLLVIENQTQLSEVPFSDRFKVLERWVIEAVKSSKNDDGGGGGGGGGLYTCKLTVYAEVIMISQCKFEPQIKKKASDAFTDLTKGWCKLATKALEATKEQKRKRTRHEQPQDQQVFDDEDKRIRLAKTRGGATESELFAKHQKKFQELDDLVSHGDGIEVMHSIKAGAQSAFAEVLEPPSSTSASGLLKLRDGTVVEVARTRRRGTAPFSKMPRKMSLLRRFNSRGSKENRDEISS